MTPVTALLRKNNNAVIEALYLYSFVLQFYSKNIMSSTEVQAVNCLFLTKILDYNIDEAAYSKTKIIDDINSINNEIKLY